MADVQCLAGLEERCPGNLKKVGRDGMGTLLEDGQGGRNMYQVITQDRRSLQDKANH